jgi:osmotically-inducible protein OsmY
MTNAVESDREMREDPMKNDRQIQQEVLAELNRDRNITKDAIGVEVHHGVVKLAGCVGDNAMQRNAELAARRVADVTSVVMDIDVNRGFAIAPSPRKIA